MDSKDQGPLMVDATLGGKMFKGRRLSEKLNLKDSFVFPVENCRKEQKHLPNASEELRLALQAERNKNRTLTAKLDKITTLNRDLKMKYKLAIVYQEAATARADAEATNENLSETFKAETNNLRKQTQEEISVLRQNEEHLKKALEEIQASYSDLQTKYETQKAEREGERQELQELRIFKELKLKSKNKSFAKQKKHKSTDQSSHRTDLEDRKFDFHELVKLYENNISVTINQTEGSETIFKEEINLHSEASQKDLETIEKTREEKDILQEKVTALQQTLEDKEFLCHKHINDTQTSYDELNSKYQNSLYESQQVEKQNQHLKEEIVFYSKKITKQEDLIKTLQSRLRNQLETSKQTKMSFQESLNQMHLSYDSLKLSYESSIRDRQQQIEQQQQELQAEISLRSEMSRKNEKLIRELRAENADLQRDTAQKVAELEETFCETQLTFAAEIECLSAGLNRHMSINKVLRAELETRNCWKMADEVNTPSI